MNRLYAPDAGVAAGNSTSTVTTAPADTHVRHHSSLPDKAADLLNVCQQVNTQWKASPFITLVWITEPDFEKNVTQFGSILNQRLQTGGNRQYMTSDLENLDHKIDDAIPFVKSYIAGKFGPHDATARYASFGIVHKANNGYEFPNDRQGRNSSLQLMVDASVANGFTTQDYGADFWKQIQTDYNKALTTAGSTSGEVSGFVGDLNTLRTSLRRVLHSILLVLEGNYPDTFAQVRREWGFQKENY